MGREKRGKNLFVVLNYPHVALYASAPFFRNQKKVIVALTVREMPQEETASKLA